MPQRVQVGNDTLEFPDTMSDAEISAAIDKEYGGKGTKPAQQFEPSDAAAPQLRPDNGLGFLVGAKRPLDNLGIWFDKLPGGQALDDAVSGAFHVPNAQQTTKDTQTYIDMKARQGVRPGALGEVGGSLAAGLPIAALTKNPWLVGAATGALNTNDPNSPGAVARDATTGAVMGKAGDVGVRAIGSAIAPRINPMIQDLIQRGVKLTPGQVMGGLPHRVEDAMRSVYGIGDLIVARQADAQKSLNRVAAQEAVDPIGYTIPHDIQEGHQMVAHVGKKLSDAYDAVIDNIDHNWNGQVRIGNGPPYSGIRLDQQFASAVANLRQMVGGMGQPEQNAFNHVLHDRMQTAFNPQTGIVSGRSMKDLDSFIGAQSRKFSKSADTYQRDLGDAFSELQSQLRDLVGRNYPQHAQTMSALNEGWAKLIRLEAAAAPAKGGVTTAEGLRQAAVHTATGMKNKAASRGQALMQDLGDKASRVMSATIPDSGTPARILASALGGAALFGGSKGMESVHVNPWAAFGLGGLSIPYASKKAADVTRALLAQRPAGATAVRAAVERARPIAAAAAGGELPRRNKNAAH